MIKSKNLLAFLFLGTSLLFCGCGKTDNNNINYIDKNVDMSVKEIALENEDELEMLNQARSAVVGISVDLYNGYAIGSGVALAEGGYILTNNHVIEGGDNITLYYADKTTGSGKVLWRDAGLDLAILKSSRNLPYLKVGSSKSLKIGETVYAMGTPLTLQFKHTVTKGIVSALNRTLEVDGENGTNFLQCLVQHDASINPGNSGGPLINNIGEVVGINTLKASQGEGLGFANPIEIGATVLNKIKDNNNYTSPYIGIFGFDSDLAQVYGESVGQDGVYIISTDGPSKNAGLVKGDIIIGIDNFVITNMQSLRLAIFNHNVGDQISISYIRSGKELKTNLTLTKK